MAHTIQSRRDTAANWILTNPVLAGGEIGFETDTHKYKIGDGATAWNSIIYYYINELEACYMAGEILNYTHTNITNGWHVFYTVPTGKKYLLHGMWSKRSSGAFTLSFLGVADAGNHEYILWSETATGVTGATAQLGEPIMLYAGWTLKIYKNDTAVGTGTSGCYGIEMDA